MLPTILFVDDELNVTRSLMRSMRKEPYRLLSASSAKEALAILEQEAVDILISDERMPEMCGSDLVSQVRQQYPDTICMVLTGQADFKSAMRSINEGEVYKYLTKPWDPAEILTHIRMALTYKEAFTKTRHDMDTQLQKELVRQKLEQEAPDLLQVETDANGCIVID